MLHHVTIVNCCPQLAIAAHSAPSQLMHALSKTNQNCAHSNSSLTSPNEPHIETQEMLHHVRFLPYRREVAGGEQNRWIQILWCAVVHWSWESVSAAAHCYSRGTLSPGLLNNSVSLDLFAEQLVSVLSRVF